MLAVNLLTFDLWVYLSCRKLEEVHNNFMDEKDRLITEIYNESKERARWERFEVTRVASGSGSEALKTKL